MKLFFALTLTTVLSVNQQPNFTLTNTHLGNLELTKLNVDELENQISEAFPNFQTERGIGQQDGPDYIYYSVLDRTEELFIIRLDGQDSTRIDEIWITSSRIKNQQGISVGNSLEELKSTIQKLQLNADLHFNIYASQPYSSISYRLKAGSIKMLNDSTMMSPDYTVQEWQIDNPDIEFIIWRN